MVMKLQYEPQGTLRRSYFYSFVMLQEAQGLHKLSLNDFHMLLAARPHFNLERKWTDEGTRLFCQAASVCIRQARCQ